MTPLPPDVHAEFDVTARTVKLTVKPALEIHPIVLTLPFWYVRHLANQINAHDVGVEQKARKPSAGSRP